jgi:hypothetical protein
MGIRETVRNWLFRDITEDRDADRTDYFASWGDGWYSPVLTFSGLNLDEVIQSAWASYVAIDGNSRTMASLDPVVQMRRGGTWKQAPDSHPLWVWLADPMGPDPVYPFWSWGRLMHLVFLHRYAAGNCYLKPQIVGRGESRRIYAVVPFLSPGSMGATEDPDLKTVEKYYYLGDQYDPSQIVNISVPGADSYWKGSSPLRAAMGAISTENYAATRQDAALRNRIGLGPIVAIKTPLGPNKNQEDELYDRLIANYQDAKNEGLPWIVGGEIEVTEGPKASDLELFETRKYAANQILSVIGMPPPVAGQLDRATWANFEQANISWWTHYLFPNLNDTYRAINAQLVSQVYGPDVRVWYDLTGSDIAHQLFGQRVKTALELQKLGYSTNDINQRLELGMDSPEYLDLPNTQLVQAGRVDLSAVVKMLQEGLGALVKDDEPEPDPPPQMIPPTVPVPELQPAEEGQDGDGDEDETP